MDIEEDTQQNDTKVPPFLAIRAAVMVLVNWLVENTPSRPHDTFDPEPFLHPAEQDQTEEM